jgi:hypothetical protein
MYYVRLEKMSGPFMERAKNTLFIQDFFYLFTTYKQ